MTPRNLADDSPIAPFPCRPATAEVAKGRRHLARRSWILVLLLAISGCAGYQIGNRSLYRTDLQTIHVPIFQTNSLRPDLAEWLTEAVIKEIETRTPYKVVNSPLADSILTARILRDNKRVVSEDANDQPRNLTFSQTVHITWIDNRGQILMQNAIKLGNKFVPEGGQSITSAEQTVIRRTAAQIVSQMELNNW
jgi:hypothetical protein